LRVLDCKKTSCGQVIQELQIKDSCLCAACKEHFAELRQALDTLRIDYTFSPYLVRGLDYYTRTVFEIVHPQLGAQDALGAGGRYDNLLEELGGAAVPAAGFALGSERLFLIKKPQNHQVPVKELVYIITLGETCKKEGFKIMADLRQAGLAADTDYQNRSLKGAMRRSSDLGARFTLIIGEDELKKGCVALKDMLTGKQEELLQEKIVSCLTQRLNNPAGE
jgi:histidyl-tRNA synthetase